MHKNTNYHFDSKNYLHFDRKRVFNNKTATYVKNPRNITSHSFYPFIRYIKKTDKYYINLENEFEDIIDSRPVKSKKRKIMYASHIDNFIYKQYGEELNKFYNEWVEKNHIDENAIAYRSRLGQRGKSNIDYAAEVINTIQDSGSCYVIIGDFESYFDTLDHNLLKTNLCEVLNVSRLPDDWFKLFQSITQYSYYNKRLINKHCGSDNKLRQTKQYNYFKTPKDFREFKNKYPIQINKSERGIPQGTAISAVLSNVYAINFDVDMKKLVSEYGGSYRRYSDDFIFIIPTHCDQDRVTLKVFEKIVESIDMLVKKYKLNLEINKTKKYRYLQREITNIEETNQEKMDYLGFLFDGKNVKMRGESPYKFYRNAYKLIKKAKKVQVQKGLKKIPYRRKLYGLYTDKGINQKPYGNFITYAKNSQKIFDEISPNTNNLIMQQIKNRKHKLEKALGYTLGIKID